MYKCCGQECPTPYCPLCGAEAMGTSLYALLKHCRVQEKSMTRQIQKYEIKGREPSAGAYTLHQKWKSWAEELEKLMCAQLGSIHRIEEQ